MTTKAMTRRGVTSPFYGGRDPFERFVERFFGTDPFRTEMAPWTEDLSNRTWMPAVDVRETDDSYIVNAELPGLTKKDIDITLEDNVLRLSGERRFEKEDERDDYHRIERAYGSFSRAFTLGGGVDASNVKASFKDGVLTVTVPKAEETKPRRIEIH